MIERLDAAAHEQRCTGEGVGRIGLKTVEGARKLRREGIAQIMRHDLDGKADRAGGLLEEGDAFGIDFEYGQPPRQFLSREYAAEQSDRERDRIVIAENG